MSDPGLQAGRRSGARLGVAHAPMIRGHDPSGRARDFRGVEHPSTAADLSQIALRRITGIAVAPARLGRAAILVHNRASADWSGVHMPQLIRITRDPAVMGGKPCIRGMRVTVGTVVGLVAAGRTRDEILREYPYLEAEDIAEALSYAAWRAEEVEVPLRQP